MELPLPLKAEPKLRDSCHACAESKLKCSKEKPACARCIKRNKTCRYLVTRRAGRSQSKHAKKVSTTSPGPAQEQQPFITTSPDGNFMIEDYFATPISLQLPEFTDDSSSSVTRDWSTHSHFFDTENTPPLFDTSTLFFDAPQALSAPLHLPSSTIPGPETSNGCQNLLAEQHCGCLLQVLQLMKQLCPCAPVHCTTWSGQKLETDSGSTIQLQRVIAENQSMLDTVATVLSCQCSEDGFLLTTICLVVLKVMGRYEEAAQSASLSAANNSSADALGDDVAQFRSIDSVAVVIGGYRVKGDDSDRMGAHIVLSELHRVQGLIKGLSERLNAAGLNAKDDTTSHDSCMNVDSGALKGAAASAGQDVPMSDATEAVLPFHASFFSQLEADLRRRLRKLSESTAELHSEVLKIGSRLSGYQCRVDGRCQEELAHGAYCAIALLDLTVPHEERLLPHWIGQLSLPDDRSCRKNDREEIVELEISYIVALPTYIFVFHHVHTRIRYKRSGTFMSQGEMELQDNPKRRGNDELVAVADEDDGIEYPSGFRLLYLFLALILCMLLAVIDLTITATAVPHITDEFHSLDDIGWYASVFFMTVASSQSSWGKIYRYFDLKNMFLVAMGVFELGNVICGAAPTSNALIVGRAITGIGAAGVIAGCFTVAAFAVRPTQRPAFTGGLAATYGIGSSIGPIIGGVLSDRVSWRWCFYINLPIGGFAAAVLFLFFESPAHSRNEADHRASWKEKMLQMDFPGFFCCIAAVTCLLLALLWGGTTKSWNSSEVIGTLVGFFLFTILFVLVEWKSGERAMVVPRIMKQRVVLFGTIGGFFAGGAQFVLVYYVPIYFQAILGTTAQDSGVRNLPYIIGSTITTVLAGATITNTGFFTPLIVGGGALWTVAAGLISTWSQTTSTGQWIGYQVLAGLAVGLCYQPPILAAQALAAPTDVAATSAILLFFQTMGGAFMVSAAQTAFTNGLIQKLMLYSPGTNVKAVIATGLQELRVKYHGAELDAIIQSYMGGLRISFAIIVGLAGASTVAGMFMPWKSIKTIQAEKNVENSD
ncbi:major facilitator superfamily transporter [Seiridium cupressi]